MLLHLTPLAEVQKMFVFHPQKTYRLFARLRTQNRLVEGDDWVMNDQRILLDLPRFVAELERDGYKVVKRADDLRDQVITDDLERHHTPTSDDSPPLSDRKQTTPLEDTEDQVITPDDSSAEPSLGDVKAILEAKNETIAALKGETESQRKVIESLAKQNATLVNMTHRLTAGSQEGRDDRADDPDRTTPKLTLLREDDGQE